MTWDEFIEKRKLERLALKIEDGREITEIQCPYCGQLVYRRTDIILTSYPPKYRYECLNCDWLGVG